VLLGKPGQGMTIAEGFMDEFGIEYCAEFPAGSFHEIAVFDGSFQFNRLS
jgi:hypothetical protein